MKATTKEGHQPRAIKILRKEKISDKEKFKAEIEILKKLVRKADYDGKY